MDICSKLTIVIPTHYRHSYLKRLLDYYSREDIRILVADSTDERFPHPALSTKVSYIHYPETSYADKMAAIFNNVETDYAVLCADDDFLVPSTLKQCLQFLERNPEYSSVQGNAVRFKCGKSIEVVPICMHSIDCHINSSSAAQRMVQNMNPYRHLYYAVHRVDVLKAVFQQVNPKLSFDFAEISQALVSVIHGKHRLLPLFYHARESMNTGDKDIVRVIEYLEKDSLRTKLDEFIAVIAEHYCEITGEKTRSRAILAVKDALKAYHEHVSKRLKPKPVEKQLITNHIHIRRIIKKFLPISILQLYSDLKQRKPEVNPVKWSKENIEVQIRKVDGVPGFPFDDEQAKEEWKRIESTILKHSI